MKEIILKIFSYKRNNWSFMEKGKILRKQGNEKKEDIGTDLN